MANDKFRAKDWDENINLVVYFSIILSGMGITWLALNDVPAGIRYITIFLVGVSFLFITFFFLDETQKETMQKIIKSPFTTDYDVAIGMYLLGWLIPIIISFVTNLFGKAYNIAQLMIPLSASDVLNEIQAQSFSVAETQADPFWQWFITVFTAGSIEEFVFGFVLMLVGVVIGMMVWRLIATERTSATQGAKSFYILFGLIFSGLIFGGVHKLNNTYVGIMFLIAILFRIAMNWGLYGFGVFLSFTLGYHQSNNAVWFYSTYGASTTFNALFSVGGIAIIVFFTLIVIYVIRNFFTIVKKVPQVFRG